jgi:hypothetical protein
MRKTAIIAILVISLFLMGCAQQQIKAVSEKEYESSKSEPAKTTTSTKKTTTETKTYTVESEKEPAQAVTVKESTTGDDVTFKKLDTYERSKELKETCYLAYPIECAKYFAKDGIIYVTLKNVGYGSKINQVTLTFDNEECDPAETYIEPGQNKDFECFVDANADYASGTLEIEYYKPIGKVHESKTGQLAVMME